MSWTTGRDAPRAVPVSMHNLVIRLYGNRCYVCDVNRYDEIDHVIPWSEGGGDNVENLRPICSGCHKTKTARERDRGRKRRAAKAKRPAEKHPLEG